MIREVDLNRNGKIEFYEFLNLMARKLQKDSEEAEVKQEFQVFDKDKSGQISPSELRRVMDGIGK